MVAIVPTAEAEEPDKDAEIDEDEEGEEDDNFSVESGPAGPSYAELLYRRSCTPAEIFAEGDHDFCIFGETVPKIIEQEFEQKKLLSSHDEADPAALRENLASLGVGLVCRKAKKPGVPNQDNIMFCRTHEYTVCGVADGHGEFGHWASHWVARFAMSFILSEITPKKVLPTDEDLQRLFNVVHEALKQVSMFGVWNSDKEEGTGEGTFDLALSGSTLSLFFAQRSTRKAVSAWVGDSRCVLFHSGKPVEDVDGEAPMCSKLSVQSITADHNPRDVGERQRMFSMGGNIAGGRVQTGGGGTADSGLAMTRALGDLTLHSFGVIHKPGIRRMTIGSEDQGPCVLCCSDGVWEFLSNDEAARFIGDGGPKAVSEATEELVAEARTKWLEQEEEETDDLSAVVVWL